MGVHKNQFKEVASIKIAGYFDIFSKIITQFGLFEKQQADLVCCLEQVKNVPKDVIAIYDRAYGSQILPFLHNLNGSTYLIRLKTDFSNIVKKFMQSSDNDIIVTEPLSDKTCKKLTELGIKHSKNGEISYRLVKVILSTGEIEVLMTNVDNTFTLSDLYTLYGMRWGIETCFFCLKSFQMLGTFSGYSELAVRQDIYVNLLFYNLQTIAQLEAEKKAKMLSIKRKHKENKNRKAENLGYQINRNVGTNTLSMHLFELFTCPEAQLGAVLEKMEEIFLQSLEKIKPHQQKRERKMHRQNDRHHTEKNYKRGM